MGISLQQYRSRIGRFLPSNYKIVQIQSNSISIENVPNILLVSVLVTAIVSFSFTTSPNVLGSWDCSQSKIYESYTASFSLDIYYELTSPISYQQVSNYLELSNFHARYLYGNKQTKGMKIAHFNKGPGHLSSKRTEIESLISGLHPHVLGISEANLMKSKDYEHVQISDYVLHKSLTIDNPDLAYSRVVVYTHKSLICKTRYDLMSNDCSSVWTQVGLPNKKQILVCNFYREWQLLNQQDNSSQSVQAQLSRWVTFIDQWEAALKSGLEVLVLGDMNINHLDWALPNGQQSSQTTKLCPLIVELFSRILPHSVSQCVSVPTREATNWNGQFLC